MSNGDWFREACERAKARNAALPKGARPVVTRPPRRRHDSPEEGRRMTIDEHANYDNFGPVEGYVVAGWEHLINGADRLAIDWDGDTHPDLASAQIALDECHAAGWPSWRVYALLPVKADGIAVQP